MLWVFEGHELKRDEKAMGRVEKFLYALYSWTLADTISIEVMNAHFVSVKTTTTLNCRSAALTNDCAKNHCGLGNGISMFELTMLLKATQMDSYESTKRSCNESGQVPWSELFTLFSATGLAIVSFCYAE